MHDFKVFLLINGSMILSIILGMLGLGFLMLVQDDARPGYGETDRVGVLGRQHDNARLRIDVPDRG